ncbi:MAG: hypothetical protein KAV87_44600, partial [Desulfobacteraceae bacterium]|nr:hypothetical protein [Desulfobacteraceae bacterium]
EEKNEPLYLEGKRLYFFASYNAVLAVGLAAMLIVLVAWGKYMEPTSTGSPANFPYVLISALITMTFAGAAGSTLCNLRGRFKYSREDSGFPRRLEIPFYIRPFSGALTGLFTFFVASLLVSSLSLDASNQSWTSLAGRIPFIAVALLAGFAAQEFLKRLKEVAKTLFSQNDRSPKQED